MMTPSMLSLTFISTLILSGSWSATGSGSGDFTTGPKTWWAKRYDSTLYTAGRLSERMIKYAAEDGFASIISVLPAPETDVINGEIYPSTDAERHLAVDVCNMTWAVLLDDMDWKVKELYDNFVELYNEMPKPILLHCRSSYSAGFLAGLYKAAEYKASLPVADLLDHTGQEEFYSLTDLTGHDYTYDTVQRELAAEVLQESVLCHPQQPDRQLATWFFSYWQVTPIYRNVYIAGQIQSSNLQSIVELGIKGIVNLRQGVTTSGDPSQEEVTLLNIADDTGTYANGGRQVEGQLLDSRLNEHVLTDYISENSTLNYEDKNELEFGDDVGYSETMEMEAVEAVEGLQYLHTPIEADATFTEALWEEYGSSWLSMEEAGPVIYHGRTKKRAVQVGLLVAAMAYNKSTTWMQKRYTALGYQSDAGVMATWSTLLSRDSSDDTPKYMTGEDPLCPTSPISVAATSSLDMRMSGLILLTLLQLVLLMV